MVADENTGLVDAVAAMRRELGDLAGPVRFEVDNIELEFTGALTKDAGIRALGGWAQSLVSPGPTRTD